MTKTIQFETLSSKLINHWEQVNQKLITLAEAIPESDYDTSLIKETRTVADILRHVAFWNRYVADTARGTKADDTTNELPKDEFATKKRILDAAKRSAADVSDAIGQLKAGLSTEFSEMLLSFIEHNSEHYGQLVVYARLNGIIPPTSRA